jgi:hypothetical protein
MSTQEGEGDSLSLFSLLIRTKNKTTYLDLVKLCVKDVLHIDSEIYLGGLVCGKNYCYSYEIVILLFDKSLFL